MTPLCRLILNLFEFGVHGNTNKEEVETEECQCEVSEGHTAQLVVKLKVKQKVQVKSDT